MEWVSSDFPTRLRKAELDSFSPLWRADIPWIEKPNLRRRGWSGVVALTLGDETFFIKRQKRHCFHTLRYPLGKPTLWREWHNIKYCQSIGLPVPEVLYYGETRDKRALMVTRAIEGYTPFIHYVNRVHNAEERMAVLRALAPLFKTMTRHALRHGCCYAKHFFVRTGPDGLAQTCMIDLEKMRRRYRRKRARDANLGQFLGHLPELTEKEQDFFLRQIVADDVERGALAVKIRQRVARHVARREQMERAALSDNPVSDTRADLASPDIGEAKRPARLFR